MGRQQTFHEGKLSESHAIPTSKIQNKFQKNPKYKNKNGLYPGFQVSFSFREENFAKVLSEQTF